MQARDRRRTGRGAAWLVALALIWTAASGVLAPAAGAECLRGANAAGADFGVVPGEHGRTYFWPSRATFAYLRSKGMNVVRLPFRWEHLQPALNRPFEPVELERLTTAVETATGLGLTVILDPHNHAKYFGNVVGSPQVPRAAFVDLWRRLSALYAGREDVIFLLMNEPIHVTARDWLGSVNAAIAAIRETGADNLIMVPGTEWSAAVNWFTAQDGGSNAEVFTRVEDPLDHYAFDIHQYMDGNFSGTWEACDRAEEALGFVSRVTDWLEETGNRGFLGEFGGHARPDCYRGLNAMVAHINSRPDVWIGWAIWAAGDAWGDYPLSIQPRDGKDRPQLVAIERQIPRRSAAARACPALARPGDRPEQRPEDPSAAGEGTQ